MVSAVLNLMTQIEIGDIYNHSKKNEEINFSLHCGICLEINLIYEILSKYR